MSTSLMREVLHMRIGKKVTVGALALVTVVTLAACSKQSSATNTTQKTWSRMEKDVISTMDPALITDSISGQAAADTTEGLYRYYGNELKPGLAKTLAKPTHNGTVYTFKLRQAQWSNGDPVTANDFVYAWRRTVDPATKSQYAYLYSGIKNADAIQAGKAKAATLGVKALDKYTFQVTLEQAIPYFDKMMVSNAFYPVDPKVVAKAGKKFGSQSQYIVANGPYKLTKWNGTGNSWVEVKNPKYWNAKAVKIDKINVQVVKDATTAMNLYEAGKLDDALLDGDQAAQAQSNKDYKGLRQASVSYLNFNTKRIPAFNNVKIRRAVSMSLNRPQFVKKVLDDGSIAASNLTSEGLAKDPSNGKDFTKEISQDATHYTTYHPAEAKKLWQEGLKETGINGMNVTLLCDDTSAAKHSAEYLQSALESNLPGFKLTINSVPFKSRLAKSQAGDYDMTTTGWGADFPDPITFLDLFAPGGAGASYTRNWHSDAYNKLITASKTTDADSAEKRWQDLVQAQELLTKEVGTVPLYQAVQSHLINKKIQGLSYGPNNMYNFIGATLK
jgi:oligopeptide transport system substrate-binding protein